MMDDKNMVIVSLSYIATITLLFGGYMLFRQPSANIRLVFTVVSNIVSGLLGLAMGKALGKDKANDPTKLDKPGQGEP